MASYTDDLLFAEEFDLADFDDFALGFRDRYGAHNVGSLEEDPEMLEYEELLELGMSLGAGARD